MKLYLQFVPNQVGGDSPVLTSIEARLSSGDETGTDQWRACGGLNVRVHRQGAQGTALMLDESICVRLCAGQIKGIQISVWPVCGVDPEFIAARRSEGAMPRLFVEYLWADGDGWRFSLAGAKYPIETFEARASEDDDPAEHVDDGLFIKWSGSGTPTLDGGAIRGALIRGEVDGIVLTVGE